MKLLNLETLEREFLKFPKLLIVDVIVLVMSKYFIYICVSLNELYYVNQLIKVESVY